MHSPLKAKNKNSRRIMPVTKYTNSTKLKIKTNKKSIRLHDLYTHIHISILELSNKLYDTSSNTRLDHWLSILVSTFSHKNYHYIQYKN